jgi:hypothetical protein
MERPRFKMAGYHLELKDDDVIHAAWVDDNFDYHIG